MHSLQTTRLKIIKESRPEELIFAIGNLCSKDLAESVIAEICSTPSSEMICLIFRVDTP